jgi:hypothetical protein
MNMKIWSDRFNIYLLVLVIALGAGCKTPPKEEDNKDDSAEEKKEGRKDDKSKIVLWFHLEENLDTTGRNGPVPVYRANPELVTINRTPFLSEEELDRIKLIDAPGGIEIEVKFNELHGRRALDNVTTSNLGRRIVVLAQFDKKRRWLAAPKITHRISNGIFRFTPDADREEAEKLVKAITHQIKKTK